MKIKIDLILMLESLEPQFEAENFIMRLLIQGDYLWAKKVANGGWSLKKKRRKNLNGKSSKKILVWKDETGIMWLLDVSGGFGEFFW